MAALSWEYFGLIRIHINTICKTYNILKKQVPKIDTSFELDPIRFVLVDLTYSYLVDLVYSYVRTKISWPSKYLTRTGDDFPIVGIIFIRLVDQI